MKFNPHHDKLGRFTSANGGGGGGGGKSTTLTTSQIWDEEYPKAEAKYSEGVGIIVEGVRFGDKKMMAYGRDKVREGVYHLKDLQRNASKQDAKDLQSVIDNWNDEISYQYSRL